MKKAVMDHAFKSRKKMVEGSDEEEASERPEEAKGEIMAENEMKESPNKNKKVPNATNQAMKKRMENLKK